MAPREVSVEQIARFMVPKLPGQLEGYQNDLVHAFEHIFDYPAAREFLREAIAKPKCSVCLRSLVTEISAQPERLRRFIAAIDWARVYGSVTPTELAEKGLTEDRIIPPPLMLAGTYLDIADTKEAYKELIQNLCQRGANYVGIAVRPLESGAIRVYFY